MSIPQLLDFKVTTPLLTGAGAASTAGWLTAPDRRFGPPEPLGHDLTIRFALQPAQDLLWRLRRAHFAKLAWARLAWQQALLPTRADDELVSLTYLHDQWQRLGIVPYPHQVEAAKRVINELGGLAILADEVGLGKTIQAGLILREYMLRRQVKRTLILCPASLIWQWYYELKDKFLITPAIQRTEYDWERAQVIIASLDTAKRQPHADIIHSLSYDMLIIDEAHKLKNERTTNYAFVSQIEKTYALFLTATPLQNNIRELFNIVSLLQPTLLGTRHTFRRQFTGASRRVHDGDELKRRLEHVMIRNRRGPDTVQLLPRHVQAITVKFHDTQRALYDAIAKLTWTDQTNRALPNTALTRLTLLREACSSTAACYSTLQRLARKSPSEQTHATLQHLLRLAENVTAEAKLDDAISLVRDIGEQLIIFTEYRATLNLILDRLHDLGISALGFDGTLSSNRKDWIKELFRRRAQVLVSSESGAEGLNFQFCRHVINYDLPWNPMKLEQRIGRVHRLGQTREVHVYNMVTENTIEQHIVQLLYEKIDLFEAAIGELDEILTHTPFAAYTFERELTKLLQTAQTPAEIKERLTALTKQIRPQAPE